MSAESEHSCKAHLQRREQEGGVRGERDGGDGDLLLERDLPPVRKPVSTHAHEHMPRQASAAAARTAHASKNKHPEKKLS